MKKVLMISYYFPPLADVGSLRALGFAQHLPEFGWQPYVLSVKNPDTSLCRLGTEKPPQDIKTFYCRSWFHLNKISWKANGALRIFLKLFGVHIKNNVLHDLICLPDVFVGWTMPAFFKGASIIKRYGIDVIYVSCKPFSSTLTGVLLKKFFRIPLILDFRDPVSFPNDPTSGGPIGKTRKQIIRKIEAFVLSRADRFLTTTKTTRRTYQVIYPYLNDKATTIYNGFYLGYQKQDELGFDKFTICYVGNFYYNLIPSDTFFLALKKIVEQRLIYASQIRFLYVGGIKETDNWINRIIDTYQLNGVIETTGYLPRGEVQTILRKSALMLLRIVPPMISTKLFEALRDGVPILAIIEKGEVAHLINRYSSCSYVITSRDVDEVVSAIMDAFDKWKNGHLLKIPNQNYLQRFNKRYLTSEFSKILDVVY